MIRYRSRGGFVPTSFSELLPLISNAEPFLLLDRDGTLVDIAERPVDAVIPISTLDLISDLASSLGGRVAVISGRGLARLRCEFDDGKIILAGSYGLEICFPDGEEFVHSAAAASADSIFDVRAELASLVATDERLVLDDHRLSLCLHFKRLRETEQEAIVERVRSIVSQFPALTVKLPGTSCEIVPDVDWDKGKAVGYIARERFCREHDSFFIAIGDSDADESLFAFAQANNGIGMSVGADRKTRAVACLDSPCDVIAFLEQLSLYLSTRQPPLKSVGQNIS